ncbi:DUF3365 domain-containing protein [Oxynema sp. CENA135]|uniref:c-type heme family protein n=1 Tax=Oxynema sp. CENA135 TaxID=984206 RepID=UPI0019099B29|nr:DUF3365 domain-containing protein [Oxynema sp. CENA135]MBK4728858.1 DUF3365 domain-containing protein [Oxynema sp. CENA135]
MRIKNLKLARQFTLFLSVVFVLSIAFCGTILSDALQKKARDEVATQSLLLMQTMNAVRTYTSQEINPLLAPRLETETAFIPETVPAYSARQVFENLRDSPEYKNFFYKEAVVNPTNLRDLPDGFEQETIAKFRQNPELKETWGYRQLFGEQVFYKARPIQITEASCLRCHGDPKTAPKSLLATYGNQTGFGWNLNETIGIQTVYVPSEAVFSLSRQYWAGVMGTFIVTFAIAIVLINILLKRHVIHPLQPMARVAEKIGTEQLDDTLERDRDLKKLATLSQQQNELGHLARIFQQMAHGVYLREQKLGQQLQQLQRQSQESSVNSTSSSRDRTDPGYLNALLNKAKQLRGDRPQ